MIRRRTVFLWLSDNVLLLTIISTNHYCAMAHDSIIYCFYHFHDMQSEHKTTYSEFQTTLIRSALRETNAMDIGHYNNY